jgi:hypothetical protein
MTTRVLGDTAILTGRSLRHITRSPDTIITTTIMPVAFMLLFVYVFGGAISQGSASYVNYMLPGILLITIAMGVSYTASPSAATSGSSWPGVSASSSSRTPSPWSSTTAGSADLG